MTAAPPSPPTSPRPRTRPPAARCRWPSRATRSCPTWVVAGALCANPASGTCTPVGAAAAVTPLYPAPLSANAYLTGSLTAPSLTLVFGPPFAQTLVGQVSLATNATTFTGLPDFPLTDLKVKLDGGTKSVFDATCKPPSGSATATPHLPERRPDQAGRRPVHDLTLQAEHQLAAGSSGSTKPARQGAPRRRRLGLGLDHRQAVAGLPGRGRQERGQAQRAHRGAAARPALRRAIASTGR